MCLVPSKQVGLSDQEEMLSTGWCVIIFYLLHCASIQDSTMVIKVDNSGIMCSISATNFEHGPCTIIQD
jgi:hypothetical protein